MEIKEKVLYRCKEPRIAMVRRLHYDAGGDMTMTKYVIRKDYKDAAVFRTKRAAKLKGKIYTGSFPTKIHKVK